MLSFKVDGKDISTIVNAVPQASVGLKYAKKRLHVTTSTGISFAVEPKSDKSSKGKLLLACPWGSIKMAGVKAGWGAQKLWPKIQKEILSFLGAVKEAYNLPSGLFELRKNDEYLGIAIDVVKLRNSVATFVHSGLMFRLAGISFNEEDIMVSFSVEEAPPPVTRETDEELDDEDVSDWQDESLD